MPSTDCPCIYDFRTKIFLCKCFWWFVTLDLQLLKRDILFEYPFLCCYFLFLGFGSSSSSGFLSSASEVSIISSSSSGVTVLGAWAIA